MAAATEAVTSASPSSLFNGFISTLNTACFLSARLIVRSERWTDKIFIKVFSNHNWMFNIFKESFRKLYLLFISWIDRTTLELCMKFRFTANMNAAKMNEHLCDLWCFVCLYVALLPAPRESLDKTCYCGSYLSLFVALLHQMIMLLHQMYISVLWATCELKWNNVQGLCSYFKIYDTC